MPLDEKTATPFAPEVARAVARAAEIKAKRKTLAEEMRPVNEALRRIREDETRATAALLALDIDESAAKKAAMTAYLVGDPSGTRTAERKLASVRAQREEVLARRELVREAAADLAAKQRGLNEPLNALNIEFLRCEYQAHRADAIALMARALNAMNAAYLDYCVGSAAFRMLSENFADTARPGDLRPVDRERVPMWSIFSPSSIQLSICTNAASTPWPTGFMTFAANPAVMALVEQRLSEHKGALRRALEDD